MILGLDDFDLHARYRPGLQAILPIPVMAMAFGADNIPIIAALGSLAIAVGLPRLLVHMVRRLGLAVEPALWASWGGKPTTRMLRLADPLTPLADKKRWRQTLGVAARVTLPATTVEEAQDPDTADVLYEQITGYARECTREDQLLLLENRAYSYERNMLGLRPIALRVALVGVVVMAIATWVALPNSDRALPFAVALVANALVLVGWYTVPSPARVRLIADKYATRLFTVATNQLIDAS